MSVDTHFIVPIKDYNIICNLINILNPGCQMEINGFGSGYTITKNGNRIVYTTDANDPGASHWGVTVPKELCGNSIWGSLYYNKDNVELATFICSVLNGYLNESDDRREDYIKINNSNFNNPEVNHRIIKAILHGN
jgi:hypothetical protein